MELSERKLEIIYYYYHYYHLHLDYDERGISLEPLNDQDWSRERVQLL